MNMDNNRIVFCLFFFKIIIILSAYYIEFFLKILPCTLCSYQRIPYIVAIILILLFFFKVINFKKLILILGVLSFINICISFYHVGIEQGLFSELSVCKNTVDSNNAKDLLKNLQAQGIVSCKDVSFAIFGISLATINLVVNISLILFYYRVFKYEK